MPPAHHTVRPKNAGPVTLCLQVTKKLHFKVQITSPEVQDKLQACCPWLPQTSLFTLAAFLRGRPRGTARQLGEARGGPRHMGKHTDPDGGMSQRTGPARLPSAKIALGGGGSGPSPCCASHPSRPGPLLWRPLGRGPLPAQLPAADALGQGNEAAGPGCRAQVGSRHPTSGERQRECRPHHTFLCCPSPAVRPWTSCSPPLSRSRVQ